MRHPLAREPVHRLGFVGRAEPFSELEAADVALAAARGQLDDVLAVVLVDPLAELAPERDPVVAIDAAQSRAR